MGLIRQSKRRSYLFTRPHQEPQLALVQKLRQTSARHVRQKYTHLEAARAESSDLREYHDNQGGSQDVQHEGNGGMHGPEPQHDEAAGRMKQLSRPLQSASALPASRHEPAARSGGERSDLIWVPGCVTLSCSINASTSADVVGKPDRAGGFCEALRWATPLTMGSFGLKSPKRGFISRPPTLHGPARRDTVLLLNRIGIYRASRPCPASANFATACMLPLSLGGLWPLLQASFGHRRHLQRHYASRRDLSLGPSVWSYKICRSRTRSANASGTSRLALHDICSTTFTPAPQSRAGMSRAAWCPGCSWTCPTFR
jgi:hypothetical protein